MGKSLFIVLAVCIMHSGVHGESQSMSCSTVNGRTICNKETSSGNTAMAGSTAFSGPQGSSQQTYAGAGNPGDWQSSRQKVVSGDGGPSPSSDYFDFDAAEFQGAPGGFDKPVDGACSYSSTGCTENFGTNADPVPVVGGFGFASAGNFFRPEFPKFVPGTVNTPQDSPEPNGGPPVTKNIGNDNSGSQVSTGGFAGGPSVGGMSYSYSSSGSAPNFGAIEGSMSTAGGFVGGPSVGGMSYSYASSGSAPNFGANEGPMPTVAGFGFTSVGNTFSPGFPFSYVSGFASSQQDSSRPNGGGFPGGNTGGFPGGAPGAFGGGYPGAFAGGFAGAGAGAGPANFGPGVPNLPFDPFRFVFGRR